MILSYVPPGERERKAVYAEVAVNHPLPPAIILEDGSVLDLSRWGELRYKIVRIDTRIERHWLTAWGFMETKGGRYV